MTQSKGFGGSEQSGGETPQGNVSRLLSAHPKEGEPGWAAGLRKLYNSVVDEPLPASFESLLRKLDESDDG